MKAGLKSKAEKLRKNGFSFREISEKLGISKSTASLWLRDVALSKKAQNRILKLRVDGRNRASDSVMKRIVREDSVILGNVRRGMNKSAMLKDDLKIICALLYWCEGGKTEKSTLSFINSDPSLIKYFVDTFRKAFEVDESKFRVVMHIHNYHDINKQIEFWSKITRIPKSQFTKPYNKPNTGKRIKADYQGCISLRYYGRGMRQEMMFLIKEILNNRHAGVV